MTRHLVSFALAFVIGLVWSACGTPGGACSVNNCEGCCDGTICRAGVADSMCGSGGKACAACGSAETCSGNLCVARSGGGAGGGSGGGTTGGGTGGGSTGGGTGGGSAGGGAGGGSGGGSGGGAAIPDGGCGVVLCVDPAIQQLGLKMTVAPGAVTTVADTLPDGGLSGGFLSTIDSTAGGSSPTQSFVYAKFGATGLTKVGISDTAAFNSVDWDIAFRRFVIRLNGGASGPGCLSAAQVSCGGSCVGTEYDALATEPAGLTYAQDGFFDGACTYVDDGSGLGSPSTALSAFWKYPRMCVEMTKAPFIVKTGSGRLIKLTVYTYYSTVAGQDNCNTTGNLGAGVVGGTVRLRWQYLN